MLSETRITQLFGIERPILLAPMAGAAGSELAIEVSEAGGLGALPCAMLSPDQMRAEIGVIRQRTSKPFNLNFFCHVPQADPAGEAAWRRRLEAYYIELGLDPAAPLSSASRAPFDAALCEIVEEVRPQVVSFHFGLPAPALVERVRRTGAKIISSATTVAEARWLADNGCDAIIAQGNEAGGHRGIFLGTDTSTQPGTMALVPQVVDAVALPVIAAGGISDARGVAAALALGASGVQVGSAFLHCPESRISAIHRKALAQARDDQTVLTNVFTGRPARGLLNRIVREVGPMSADVPAFPLASAAIGPVRARAEANGSGDFSPLWAGQAAGLGRAIPAGELTRELADGAARILAALAGP